MKGVAEANKEVPLLSEQRSLAGSLQGFLGIDLQVKRT